MKFKSHFSYGPKLFAGEVQDLKNEICFFNSDVDFVKRYAGPVTRTIIKAIPEGWEAGVVDSRVHMLMPGWYPCIPGYHHDDVPRTREDKQPNYLNPEYRAEHIMILVNGDICPTIFAVGECEMPEVPLGQVVYKQWHKEVERLIVAGDLKPVEIENGRLVYFDWESFHTGQKASASGWRMFFRITRYTNRVPTNEIRNQTQVYLEFPMEGW